MLSLIKGWGDLSRLSQPRDVKYSNNGFINIKNCSENWVPRKCYSVYKPHGMYSNERTEQDRNVFNFPTLSLPLLGDIPVLHTVKEAGRAAAVGHHGHCREAWRSGPDLSCSVDRASWVALVGKNLPANVRRRRFDLSVGKIPWRRAQQTSPVFLPGESHGQRNVAGYSP